MATPTNPKRGLQEVSPHNLFPHITMRHIAQELERERRARQNVYPARVERGNMLQAEADRQLQLLDAMIADAKRLDVPGRTPPATHGVPWAARRDALVRELALRDRHYPQWIKTAKIRAEDAAHRRDCLQSLLEIYDDGFDWSASNGASWAGFGCSFTDPATRTRQERDAQIEAMQHLLAVYIRRGDRPMANTMRRSLALENVTAATGEQEVLAL